MAFGQSPGPNISRSLSSIDRPWLGISFGTGFLGSDSVEPDDSRDLGVSLDIPLLPTIRTRVSAGRMGVKGARFGEFALRRLTFDGVALMPFRGPGTSCQSNVVLGGGIGLYHYGLDNNSSVTRPGYHALAGLECVGSRLSFGLEITGRSIRGPANLLLPDDKMFAVDMRFGIKLRLEPTVGMRPVRYSGD
jgi:hypothetical protein